MANAQTVAEVVVPADVVVLERPSKKKLKTEEMNTFPIMRSKSMKGMNLSKTRNRDYTPRLLSRGGHTKFDWRLCQCRVLGHCVAPTPEWELHLVRVHISFAFRSSVSAARFRSHHPYRLLLRQRTSRIILPCIEIHADQHAVRRVDESECS